jgi:pimeloyl-ACP methyl ester carboxylesterase
MRFRTFNEAADRDVVFVMGWGNTWAHESVRWLVDAVADAGWTVHAAELPTNITDFRADWVEPVVEYVRDLESFALVGHSAGGLVATAIDGADTHVYLSPWWGYPEDDPDWLLDLVTEVPTAIPFLPSGIDDPAVLGEYATERQLADVPRFVSPAFVRETRDAQRRLLPADVPLAAVASSVRPALPDDEDDWSGGDGGDGEGREATAGGEEPTEVVPNPDLPTPHWSVEDDAVVFCSLTDEVVSTRAIGARVPADNVVLYEGGHELFASTSREAHLETLLAALADGTDALAD